MRYKLLGKSGLRVSELCLGTMTFGDDWGWGSSKDESRALYDAFVESGGNFIDTADLYTNGTSESFLGEFMASDRERIVLATKYTNTAPGNDPNAGGNQRKNMMQSVEASLKRLKTDYIDLYWLHVWDFTTPVEEVMRAFDDLVSQGKVLYIGISDAPAWIVSRANTLAELRSWTQFVGLQIEYSLIERTSERELLPMARELDLAVTAWSPLAGGLLTGKYRQSNNADKQEKRLEHPMMAPLVDIDERKQAIAATVVEIAEAIGKTPAQVALNWVRQQAGVMIPIIGARRLSQLRDNLACLEFTLEEEHLKRLNDVSRIELGFPHDFFSNELVQNFAFGGMRDLIDNHHES
ncbi:MAG: aldo/keto reductase [Desulfobacterales bacterium]|jgi:aryl-alcohol dehydrogenase-like predicted oxidoreductase